MPEPCEFDVPELGIEVEMRFKNQYSNTLFIYTACVIKNHSKAFSASAYVSYVHIAVGTT